MILAVMPTERSDLVHDAVLATLRSSGYRPLWNLDCQVLDDSVILTGVLPSFYLKQIAQTIVRSVDQVREVSNLVEVEPD